MPKTVRCPIHRLLMLGLLAMVAVSCTHAPRSFHVEIPVGDDTVVLEQDLFRQDRQVHMGQRTTSSGRTFGTTTTYTYRFDLQHARNVHYAFLTIDTMNVKHPQHRVLLNGREIGYLMRAAHQGVNSQYYAGNKGVRKREINSRMQRYLPGAYFLEGRNELTIESQEFRSARLGGQTYVEPYTVAGINIAVLRLTNASGGHPTAGSPSSGNAFPSHIEYFSQLTDEELYIALVKLPFLLGEISQATSIYANSISYVYARIGDYYRWIGHHARSLTYQEKAIARQEAQPLSLLTPLIRSKLALALYHLGRYESAVAACEDALKEIDAVGADDLRRTSTTQMEDPNYLRTLVFAYLAMNYYHIADKSESEYYAYRIINGFDDNWMAYAHRQMPIGKYVPVALAHQIMGDYALREKRLDEALAHYQKSRTFFGYEQRPEIFHDQRITVLLGMARVYFEQGDFDNARDIIDAVENPTSAFLWRAQLLRGLMAESEGRLTAAVARYRQSIEEIEHARTRMTSHGMKINFMADKQEPYSRMVHAMAASKRPGEAFAYAEKAKARAFLDLLSGSERLVGAKTETLAELTREEIRLRQELLDAQHEVDMRRTLFQERGVTARDTERIQRARGALTRFLSRWFRESKDFASLRSAETLSVEAVQGLLPDGVALVEYYYHGERLYAWIIERRRFSMIQKSVPAASFESLARSFRQTFGRPETGRGVSVAAVDGPGNDGTAASAGALRRLLVDGVLDQTRATKVYIVPHGILHYLPFQALRMDDRFLVETRQIGYLPSASVLQYIFGKEAGARGGLFALGNPDVGTASMSLPHAAAEVEEIRRMVDGATVLTGKDATEAAFKRNASGFRMLHIASHGEFNPEAPLLSCLRLAPGGGEDGRLETQEIFDLDLSADLVALSACNTALGKMNKGDELTGLTRAFLFAGTPSILGTFWSVNDESTRILMRGFYANLRTMDKFEAMQKAQVAMIRSTRFHHPYHWASFQMIGDYR